MLMINGESESTTDKLLYSGKTRIGAHYTLSKFYTEIIEESLSEKLYNNTSSHTV